jgi:glycosyltransferase involved in cell wall biosynthesis
VRERIPDLRFEIYGRGPFTSHLEELVRKRDLTGFVHFGGYVPLDAIPDIIRSADIGVIAYRGGVLTDLLIPTKAFEYIVVGVPVIASRTRTMEELFDEQAVRFFEPNNVEDLARAIEELSQDPAKRQRLVEGALRAYQPYRWEVMRERYVGLVKNL